MVDKKYCMSSFLMHRRIVDEDRAFSTNEKTKIYKVPNERFEVKTATELQYYLKKQVDEATNDGKAALALSGGIDSAILAKFMPKGSIAYTFKCVVPGVKVIDETERAAQYAKECGLVHKVIEIYWEDFEKYMPVLMKHKNAPIHSIEIQIYKAALMAKKDGIEKIIYGESADCLFGGLSNLLSRDWLIGDFIDRYSFVLPYKVLKEPQMILQPFISHEKKGYVDVHEFLGTEFFVESVNSYLNPSNTGGVECILPYANCHMGIELDYDRVRSGENKYLIREIFDSLYNGVKIPDKTPMPRATNEWLSDYNGPKRNEFWENCCSGMTGDQKWLVFCLEAYLDMLDSKENYE